MTFNITQSDIESRKDTLFLSTMLGWIYQLLYRKATVTKSYSHSAVVRLKNISAKMDCDDVLDGKVVSQSINKFY